MQHYVIKLVSDLRQVSCFSWYSSSSTNKTDHYDILEILLKVALSTITLTLIINIIYSLFYCKYLQIVCEKKDVVATGCAVARALPLYYGKSASTSPHSVTVEYLLMNEDSQTPLSQTELDCLTAQAYGIRLSAKIVDMPCNIMHTNTFLEVIKKYCKFRHFCI